MRYLIACIAALFLVACELETDTGPSDPTAAANKMVSLVASSDRFSSIPQQCPLAVYGSRQSVPAAVPDCAQNPAACLALCEAGDAGACFDAARVIEKGNIPNDSDRTYPLFFAGCALGAGNSCVNAAATVKNGDWTGARPAATASARCQFQTYDRMCDDGHAWGCYMVASEYRRTDGFRPRNLARFEEKRRQACAINVNSGACTNEFKPGGL